MSTTRPQNCSPCLACQDVFECILGYMRILIGRFWVLGCIPTMSLGNLVDQDILLCIGIFHSRGQHTISFGMISHTYFLQIYYMKYKKNVFAFSSNVKYIPVSSGYWVGITAVFSNVHIGKMNGSLQTHLMSAASAYTF